eukprot:CAMPEP_0172472604 /NCGR_PEP_ID=MMETSP1065-20121228/68426_1 /TAXON_ID=265537 /ORGANISM="Amphiprora paludosa, Strain CCMP125" /LENGTH=409 /DNA_ID=CAMNT_0013230751 /DNA_START=115 /DNA_END=1344 /DNA_ORIENTATION=+
MWIRSILHFLLFWTASSFFVDAGAPDSKRFLTTAINKQNPQAPKPTDSLPLPKSNMSPPSEILLVYSDVDGTLVHYPSLDKVQEAPADILRLPPSMTGMQGIISSRTMQLCRSIRKDQSTKFVLVSGMRTHTLLKRLPFLPRADAYCSEAGGRIFYPIEDGNSTDGKAAPCFKSVEFDGATPEDLESYGLVEDLEWRKRMESPSAAGPDGYVGQEIEAFGQEEKSIPAIPVSERTGELWKFAQLLESKNLVLDVKGYSSCFRVNRKHQPADNAAVMELFESLLSGRGGIDLPSTLATSTNLGCIDFYPAHSGKKNCCQYLMDKFPASHLPKRTLKENALFLCDDDNDLEMAMACEHAYLPGISSKSMEELVAQDKSQFTLTEQGEVAGTRATEAALALVLKRLASTLKP